MEDLSKIFGIKQILSTAYHPQTDGQTERMNQEVEAFLEYYKLSARQLDRIVISSRISIQ